MSEDQTLASVVESVRMPVERRFRVVGQIADNSGIWITLREDEASGSPCVRMKWREPQLADFRDKPAGVFPSGPGREDRPFIVRAERKPNSAWTVLFLCSTCSI
jgi:hypothetical protein